ncbi:hypothetical protein BD414DRAFT_484621 [Trametes punicea]|nr:hypothetical protein BD414DRAFT_484621 [Trametes punicea]
MQESCFVAFFIVYFHCLAVCMGNRLSNATRLVFHRLPRAFIPYLFVVLASILRNDLLALRRSCGKARPFLHGDSTRLR